MTTAVPQFQHEQLRLNDGSIRLVQIHGGAKTNPLALRITQFSTLKRPPYAAISYVWGTAGRTLPITINGKPFSIRPNLWHLLTHLRARGEARFLWVDALCINQNDRDERTFHVQFMSRIYEDAQVGIVWLGLPSDDRREARAIDFLVEMATHHPKKARGASFRDLYLSEKVHLRWLNLLSFCRCAYWSRTWIIQEFLQARHIQVLCGTAILEWTSFDAVFKQIRPLVSGAPSSLPVSLNSTLRTILSTIPSRLTSRRLSHTASLLEQLLHEFHDAQCTLPRDKVYGMLGIAADCGPVRGQTSNDLSTYRGPVPDYAKHITEVYFDVLKYLRDTSPAKSVSPLTVVLLQKSLGINETTIAQYTAPLSPSALADTVAQTTLYLKPDYISFVSATIPAYTSASDLKKKLLSYDWSPYVGFEIVRPRTPTPTPTPVSTPLSSSSLQPKSRRPSGPAPATARSSSSSYFSSQKHSASSTSLSTQSTLSPPIIPSTHRRNSSSSNLSRQITQTAALPDNLIPNFLRLVGHSSFPFPQTLRAVPDGIQRFHLPVPISPASDNPPPSKTSAHFTTTTPLISTTSTIPMITAPTIPPLPSQSSQPSQPPPKPTVILESSPLAQPLRLGLATSSSNPTISPIRRGDIILQFSGLPTTLLARRTGSSGKIHFIGRAVMASHSGLSHDGFGRLGREARVHPAACSEGDREIDWIMGGGGGGVAGRGGKGGGVGALSGSGSVIGNRCPTGLVSSCLERVPLEEEEEDDEDEEGEGGGRGYDSYTKRRGVNSIGSGNLSGNDTGNGPQPGSTSTSSLPSLSTPPSDSPIPTVSAGTLETNIAGLTLSGGRLAVQRSEDEARRRSKSVNENQDQNQNHERIHFEDQYREHMRQFEDVEIETDALSLWEILREI